MSKRIFASGLVLLAAFGGTDASAQTSVYDLPEKLVDANGVDLPGGKFIIGFPLINFGENVRLKADYYGRYPENHYVSALPLLSAATDFIVRPMIGGGSEEIRTGWSPFGSYAFHPYSGWETVMPDGRAYRKPAGGRFLTELHSQRWEVPGNHAIGMVDEEGNFWDYGTTSATAITMRAIYADGEIWTIKYERSPYGGRLRTVVSNRGYMIQYEYEREAAPTAPAHVDSWSRMVKISGGSLAHNYCDTSGVALCPAISAAGNSATFSHFATGYEITHSSGFKKRLENLSTFQMRLSTPGTNEEVKVSYGIFTPCDPNGIVSSVTRNGQTWNYAYEQCTEEERGVSWRLTRTDPEGQTIKVRQLSSYSLPDIYTDELGREYGIGGSPEAGYSGFSFPEYNGVGKSLNARNNRTGDWIVGKNGAALGRTATYDLVCNNLITCNRPNTTKDAKGNTTTYTYDPVHGGPLTTTGPAVGGISPFTRYEYAQRYARLMNAAGGHGPAATPIWVLVRERSCRTTQGSISGCAGGAADEVVTDHDYGPDSGPNNLLVRGIAVTADGQTRRTCFSYDSMGRKVSDTKPRAGLASCS